jgi:hypothetical protein
MEMSEVMNVSQEERQGGAKPDAAMQRLEQALQQRAERHCAMPELTQRTLRELECRALARQWMAKHPGALKRIFTPREATTLRAVVRGTRREVSGTALALLHLLCAPAWRGVGAALLGAVCGYALALSAHSLGSAQLSGWHLPLTMAQLAPGFSAVGALCAVLAAQGARVRGYLM